MRTILLVTVAAVAAAPAVAAAQPSNTPVGVAPAPLPAPVPQADYRELSPGVALGLSLGVTAAGYGAALYAGEHDSEGMGWLGAAGILFGPSFGHWYQEDIWTRGLGVRAVSATVFFAAAVSTIDICFEDCPQEDHSAAETWMKLSAAAFVIGSLDDIITAPIAADRRNRENRARAIKSLTLAPQVSPNQTGLVLAGTF